MCFLFWFFLFVVCLLVAVVVVGVNKQMKITNNRPSSLKTLNYVIGNELDAYVKDDDDNDSNLTKNKKGRKKTKSRFDFRNAAFVETIKFNLDSISISMTEFESFCNIHCIFGSFEHIGLLNECHMSVELLKEIKHLIMINDENRQIFFSDNNYDIYHLKESWYKLNSKFAIVCLKSLDLRQALNEAAAKDNTSSSTTADGKENSNINSNINTNTNTNTNTINSMKRCSSHGAEEKSENENTLTSNKNCVNEKNNSNLNCGNVKKSKKTVSSIYEIFESAIESE